EPAKKILTTKAKQPSQSFGHMADDAETDTAQAATTIANNAKAAQSKLVQQTDKSKHALEKPVTNSQDKVPNFKQGFDDGS
ncbi:rotein, partial [Francisella tularensis subsp. holarctica]|nr:rotein [Francisella tularensis subsp. holarctica]